MGAFFTVLLILVFVVVPIAALCMQTIPVRLPGVRFRDTDPQHAWALVLQYAEGTFEQRFGYPTGYYYVDEKRSSQPSKIVMREFQPAGAITDGCTAQLGALGLSGFDEGCGPGCLMAAVVAIVGAPFFLVSFMDRFFRLMLRSRVDITLQAAGPDTVAELAFYGPGGYSLRTRYAQAFAPPVLPAVLTASPAEEGTPGAAGAAGAAA